MTGIIADGARTYLEALEAEADAQLAGLRLKLAVAVDPEQRTKIQAEIADIEQRVAERKRSVFGSLF
jgi:hypothetical protein